MCCSDAASHASKTLWSDVQQSCTDAPEGGLLLRASLRPLNPVGAGGSGDGGASGATDVPEVVAHLCDADGAGQGGGLWLSLWRCAAVAAGQQPRLKVPRAHRARPLGDAARKAPPECFT